MKKKILILISCAFALISAKAQEKDYVIEVNNKKISKTEFLQIYLKNTVSRLCHQAKQINRRIFRIIQEI